MCGIAGIKIKLADKEVLLNRMMQSSVYRGPDSRGKYFYRDIALGHLRLKVIDFSPQGDQPMSNESNDIWIVHNGEIYNFKELRQELESKGHIFKSFSDTEVIIHGYEEWGVNCLDKLRGMFAFCLWDRNNKKLFLARDRLGIKPLYYYFKDGIFIFASEVRAILATGQVPKNLNLQGLLSYLKYGGLKEPLTIVDGIYSLMPAHYMVLNEDNLKFVRYWDPLDIRISKPYLRIEEIVEIIRFLLKESVRIHLISDAPIGVFLSGGIDSSSLVSLAAQIAPGLKTVSAVFSENDFSEVRYSRLIAKKYNTQHHEILITDNYFFENLELCLMAMDEPTFDGINTYFISKAAKEAGLVVALSGLGGDEVFCGYPTFKRVARLIRFCSLWDKVPKSFKKISTGIFKALFLDITPNRKIAEFLKRDSFKHPYFWTRLLFTDEERHHLLKPPLIPIDIETAKFSGLKGLDIINQVSYLELTNYMVDILLRDTDSMSMAHSLEVRVPLIDHKLIEFMLSIPGRFKTDRHMPKPLLIKSLEDSLPKEVFRRPKMGFVFPFDCWLRGRLKYEVENNLLAEDSILDTVLDNSAVLSIWKGFLSHKISWQRPWAIYVLKKWTKNYFG